MLYPTELPGREMGVSVNLTMGRFYHWQGWDCQLKRLRPVTKPWNYCVADGKRRTNASASLSTLSDKL
jgi:hypothetical protein